MDNTYTTKCRVCGKTHEWWYSTARQVGRNAFLMHMADKASSPRVYTCEYCDKNTVQDFISHS